MPELWRAGVDLAGVVTLETFMATTSGVIREILRVEFGDPDQDASFLASISPLTDVDKIVDPLFVYAGANDPRSESDLIVPARSSAAKSATPVPDPRRRASPSGARPPESARGGGWGGGRREGRRDVEDD
jgi:hypothetical protein